MIENRGTAFGREEAMFLDTVTPPGEIAQIVEADMPSFKQPVFVHFLRGELARAVRYNFLASLLVFQVRPPDSDQAAARRSLRELAVLLRHSLRSTDYLGTLRHDALGLVLPHSTHYAPSHLLARLAVESVFRAFSLRTGSAIKTAVGRFPTDATTLEDLVETAFAQLQVTSTQTEG